MYTTTQQIPMGKGQNIANLKLAKKEEIQEQAMRSFLTQKYALIKCNCCTKMVPGLIVKYDVDGKNTDQVPIHTACESCGMFISHLEESRKLEGMCLDCFADENAGIKQTANTQIIVESESFEKKCTENEKRAIQCAKRNDEVWNCKDGNPIEKYMS